MKRTISSTKLLSTTASSDSTTARALDYGFRGGGIESSHWLAPRVKSFTIVKWCFLIQIKFTTKDSQYTLYTHNNYNYIIKTKWSYFN